MVTASGKQIFPYGYQYHTGESPSLYDIAQGLGRQPRFCGQTLRFSTVLCHVLTCMEMASPKAKIHALLHDSAEAIVSDVCKTWKCDQHSAFEAQILADLYRHLGIEMRSGVDVADEVKRIDAACLAAEAHALGHAQAERWWPRDQWGDLEVQAYGLTMDSLEAKEPLRYLEPHAAGQAFMEAFEDAVAAHELVGT